jgi:hypothetical protein
VKFGARLEHAGFPAGMKCHAWWKPKGESPFIDPLAITGKSRAWETSLDATKALRLRDRFVIPGVHTGFA